jgi:hypothetical protein
LNSKIIFFTVNLDGSINFSRELGTKREDFKGHAEKQRKKSWEKKLKYLNLQQELKYKKQ